MRKQKISEAITNIDSKYVEEAADYKVVHRKSKFQSAFRVLTAAAACIFIVFGGILLWKQFHPDSAGFVGKPDGPSSENQYILTENGIYLPKKEYNLEANNSVQADMIAFFIHQGRSYTHYLDLENSSALVGEQVGTIKGLIDEWTKADGYVDGAGSISGDIYSVNGYDPAFMLCMKEEDNTIQLFVNDNDITLQYGKELFVDRLHLDENYKTLSYQTREAWNYDYGKDSISALSEDQRPLVQNFLNTLNTSLFVLSDEIPLTDPNSSIYDELEIYHLYFELADGMKIHLRLFEGGYVMLQGFHPVCVRMDVDVFNQFIETLK